MSDVSLNTTISSPSLYTLLSTRCSTARGQQPLFSTTGKHKCQQGHLGFIKKWRRMATGKIPWSFPKWKHDYRQIFLWLWTMGKSLSTNEREGTGVRGVRREMKQTTLPSKCRGKWQWRHHWAEQRRQTGRGNKPQGRGRQLLHSECLLFPSSVLPEVWICTWKFLHVYRDVGSKRWPSK